MKKQAKVNKKTFITALCISVLAGVAMSSNTHAIKYYEEQWARNTGFNDVYLFDCVLLEYEYTHNIAEDAEIVDQIGVDGPFPQEWLDEIENLYCSHQDISDLTGLEKLTNLSYLDLDNNHLESIDLSKNTNLREVSLKRNRLTSIDFSANRKLKVLNVANNHISKANLYYNTNLISLNISNNNLTELDISNSPMISDLNTDSLDLITSARVKKDGKAYRLNFPMPYYVNKPLDPVIIPTDPSQDVSSLPSFISRWTPSNSPNYIYDTDLQSYIIFNRDSLAAKIQLESPSSNNSGWIDDEDPGIIVGSAERGDTRASTSTSTVDPSVISIAPRPITIVPSLVVDGTPYDLSSTADLPTRYIGEDWDSNDYREIVDQTLIKNHQENVRLVKVEIYNSLKTAPGVDTGLSASSTPLHLFGTIPDIEVPIENIADKELSGDNGSEDEPIQDAPTRAFESEDPLDKYNYNPETILAQGAPDFRIVYYFETIKPKAGVPDTGFNTRWEGSETTSATPIATIIAFASLAVASVLHIIKCQAHKVRFKKY